MSVKKVFFLMPYCSKCGRETSSDAQFCPECGEPLQIEGGSPTVSPSPTYPQSRSIFDYLFDRMIRAAQLDVSLYEEVEADEGATTQALFVVLLASFCSGIGTAISSAITGNGPTAIGIGLFGGLVTAFLGWLAWSFITHFVGTRVFGGTASFSELLRTIGFSDSPGVLLIFSFIPVFGGLLSFGVWIWGLVAMVVAVRHALDFSTGNAVLTCIVGWIVTIILLTVIGVIFAIPFILLGL